MSNWKKYVLGTWSWKRPFYSLISIYILLLIIVCFFANKLIFHPPSQSYNQALKNLILLKNEDEKQVAALYFKGSPNMPTLLWSHGNAEDLQSLYPLLERINQMQGYNILAYDYPGYGLSEGKPAENGCYQNIKASWKYLTETLNIPQEKIIILGQSVGSGASTWLAAQDGVNPAALVLISPFKSINRVPFGVNLFPKDRFSNISRIKTVTCPLLVMHGKNDKVIKHSHGIALYEKHQAEKDMISLEKTGHNDVWNNEKSYESLFDYITSLKMGD